MLLARALLAVVRLHVVVAAALLPRPSQSRCGESPWASMPFCDGSGARSTDARVADLVGRLTAAEKTSLLGNTHGAQPVPRLGVPALPWGEALHGVVSHCYHEGEGGALSLCPTSFPHALLLAASFNRSLWAAVGDAVSTEARALNNLGTSDDIGTGPYAPLMVWAPNLNPYRDARWGRGHEVGQLEPHAHSLRPSRTPLLTAPRLA